MEFSQKYGSIEIRNTDSEAVELYIPEYDEISRVETAALQQLAQKEGTLVTQHTKAGNFNTYTMYLDEIALPG